MALRALNKNEEHLPDTLRLIQMTDVGEQMEKVLRTICRREEIDFVALSRQVSYCMNTKMLEEILTDLTTGDRIVQYVKEGKRWFKMKGGQ
jgi:stalled ribosome rescue protein Dom34